MSPISTPVDEIPNIRKELQAGFKSGKLKSIAYRKKQLLALAHLIKDNEVPFQDALRADLGRNALESNFTDIIGTITEALTAYHNVEKWAKTESAPFSLNYFAMSPQIRKEPKGVVLIIGPYNFPLWSMLGPLIGAIAAGNAAAIKPSELSPVTTALITKLFPEYLDQSLYRVINGGIDETTKVLEVQWDHIFFTGSGRVGRIVSAAAAEHLTPVTMELGGKNPAIVDRNCDVDLAARRILWGKCLNAGQICVAPDYVLVRSDFQDEFITAMKKAYMNFYPNGPHNSDLGRIISLSHFTRIKNLLDHTHGNIVVGGETVEQEKYIAPTIVKNVGVGDSLMSEEIFGPVLPIVPYTTIDEAIAYVNSKDHPLVLHVFSRDKIFKAKVFDNTQSGAAVANEVLLHSAADGLPFGGIGASGSGYHTGKYGFDTFTHLRATLDSPSFVDKFLGFRFPPYSEKNLKHMNKMIMPKLPSDIGRGGFGKWVVLMLAMVVAGIVASRKGTIRA